MVVDLQLPMQLVPITTRSHHGHDRMVVGLQLPMQLVPITTRNRHGHDHMVVGFTTTNAISAYHN